MKRKTKIVSLSLTLIIVLIISLIGVGKYYMNQSAEHQHEEMVVYVKKYHQVIEDDLRESDKNNFIKSITIDYGTIEHNPMGGINVDGYVNGNRTLKFQSGLNNFVIDGQRKVEPMAMIISLKLNQKLGDE
ncbi:MAG TPA: DUF1310 domain-containing protein [Candidatus Ligilactobacillus excrementipullorum]|nr:DUF1310 domain-containing protein [Candidatus Ligilactobacillus excrementipullorum]